MQLLSHTNMSITKISENCGFSSLSYFGKVFRVLMGCTPGKYRSGNNDYS